MSIMEEGDRPLDMMVTKDNTNIQNALTVGEFFAQKNVFVTGGTGFVGTVLIEALLASHRDIGTIYVLVREKRGLTPAERINRLLQKPIFAGHNNDALKKIVPIVGELGAPNFGIEGKILNDLKEKVNIIYHSAATIRFNTHLRAAIKSNLTGTYRTIELAKSLKNLSAYIYLSTAFCNSNFRGYTEEYVYLSNCDPHEMIDKAEHDEIWNNMSEEDCIKIIEDFPNTYTFTKNLAENLILKEMSGLPAGIVRPSVVYGTWEHPIPGWIGNANSGHLGFLAGFIKGMFRTMSGRPSSTVDIIPCDFVVNSSLAMAWYCGTRALSTPEVIHCTSGEVNPLSLARFTKILSESVKRHPCDYFVWRPSVKLRNGWRHLLFFFIFQVLPAVCFLIPEKLFSLGMTHHTALEYMKVFHNGTKAFDFFLDKKFQYSLKNARRINSLMKNEDKKRYNFDASLCDWSEFMDRCLIGVRHFYFRESQKTTKWHRICWILCEIIYYIGQIVMFGVLYMILNALLGFKIGTTIAIVLWSFLMWL